MHVLFGGVGMHGIIWEQVRVQYSGVLNTGHLNGGTI